jgi:hypothetical protein
MVRLTTFLFFLKNTPPTPLSTNSHAGFMTFSKTRFFRPRKKLFFDDPDPPFFCVRVSRRYEETKRDGGQEWKRGIFNLEIKNS